MAQASAAWLRILQPWEVVSKVKADEKVVAGFLYRDDKGLGGVEDVGDQPARLQTGGSWEARLQLELEEASLTTEEPGSEARGQRLHFVPLHVQVWERSKVTFCPTTRERSKVMFCPTIQE